MFAFVGGEQGQEQEQEQGRGRGQQQQSQSQSRGRSSHTSPKVVLDRPSLELLRGSKIDYTMELIGSQFKIVDNPHATSSCGCGTSFDVKDLP